MKLGIIARCDSRGIAYQSYEAVQGLKPDRVLVILLNDRHWPEEPGRFSGKNVSYINSDLGTRVLDQTKVRKFLDGLDAVFSVETLYDWRMVEMADELGVRLVVQGNPEFYTHHRDPDRPHPHQWAWPSPWTLDGLPDGPLLPVPAPFSLVEDQADPDDEVLRVLHVAGHRALGDRNGTDSFFEALPLIGSKVHVTVYGQDGALPPVRIGRHMTIETFPNGVADRWQLYQNQHLVVLPRRYGGLSLPAIEASASGVVPLMPDVPENQLWPIVPLPARPGRLQRVPYGRVPTWSTRPLDIASAIDRLNGNRERLADLMDNAARWADDNSWDGWADRYREVFAG